MRASELPSPASIKRRLSPVPLTMLALVALLGGKLWTTMPMTMVTAGAPATSQLADLAPALGGVTDPSSHADTPEALLPDRQPSLTDPASIEPAAGPVGLETEPLRAEPFLEERRELARQQEALQVRQLALQAAETRLRELLGTLETIRADIDSGLAQLEAQDEERMAGLVRLYENMKPKKAAVIFNELEFDVLTTLALRISERKLAPIVSAMNPVVARRLTKELARNRRDDLRPPVTGAPS